MTSPRARMSLSGRWSFWPEKEHSVTSDPLDPEFVGRTQRDAALGPAREIEVPGAWQAQFADLRSHSGCAWYERAVTVPETWRGRRVRVCFGAVDYHCSVWLNGRRAGSHEGGYLPFFFDVTELLRFEDPNLITLLVLDPGPGDESPVAFAEIPHGKQSWYGPLGGPWQAVWLEATGATFIERVLIRSDPSTGAVVAAPKVNGALDAEATLTTTVTSPEGTRTWSSAPSRAAPDGAGELGVDIAEPRLWSPTSPSLYQLEVALEAGGRVVDRWSDAFGFRSIAAEGSHLLLNGEPLYLIGALDQDYYLDSICTPPSDDLLRRQVLLARELGLNCLRCHIKIPDPRYLYWADRLGILVWAELPNWGSLTAAAAARARATFEGLVERDFNHPSIIIWTIANEGWGLDLPSNEDHRRWLRETFRWAKDLDPSRLVVDNSPCPPNFHLESDLNDFHLYRAYPEGEASWRDWTAAWVADPGSTYSPHGDGVPGDGRPQILSEFGYWGLPDIAGLLDEDGRPPWWFATGAGWGDGVVQPAGVRERFFEWGLEDVFGSWPDFVAHSQQHQFEGLSGAIADLRSHPQISGYVITEFTDVQWESNGLLDMARNPKSYHQRAAQLNAPDVVWATPRHRRVRPGESIEIGVTVSHYSGKDLDDGEVAWSIPALHASGRLGPLRLWRTSVVRAGRFEVSVDLPQPARPVVEVVLRDRRGREAARSSCELLVLPERRARLDPATLTTRATGAGDEVVVAMRWSEEVAAHLRRGGRALLLAHGEDALPPGGALTLRARPGTRWEGDWAQGMGWLRPEVHEPLGIGPRVSRLFSGLTPELVMLGYQAGAARDILAGLYVGWIRDPVATIGAFRAGAGAGIVCTWPLLASYGPDPLATELVDRLIELVASRALEPVTALGVS